MLPESTSVKKSLIQSEHRQPISEANLHTRVTIVIREFEHFDNMLPKTIEYLEKALPKVKIIVLADIVNTVLLIRYV